MRPNYMQAGGPTKMRIIVIVFLLLAFFSPHNSGALAQDPVDASASVNELTQRLQEQQQELEALRQTQAQIQELAKGSKQLETGLLELKSGVEKLGENLKITTVDKKWGIGVFGSLNGEMLYSEARPVLPSGVTFLFPDLGKDTSAFEVHGKSTNIGMALQGPEIGGYQAGGLFLTNLYGEQFQADEYGFFILRAYGELKNDFSRISVGLDGDVINPLSPTTLNFNAGNLAGNLGFFRGQVRHERYFERDQYKVTTQFAVSDPVNTSFAEFSVPPNNLLETNGWPNIEGRIAVGLGFPTEEQGKLKRPIEIGFSGLVGQLRRTRIPTLPNIDLDTWAVGVDLDVALNHRNGFRGEFFSGQAIGNYNAAVLQVDNDNFGAVRSTGGWGEFYHYWNPCLHSHFGYGIDDPLDNTLLPGLAAARITRNDFFFGNLIWDVTPNLELGFEVSHWETSYLNITPIDIDNSAMIYHTRVRLKF